METEVKLRTITTIYTRQHNCHKLVVIHLYVYKVYHLDCDEKVSLTVGK